MAITLYFILYFLNFIRFKVVFLSLNIAILSFYNFLFYIIYIFFNYKPEFFYLKLFYILLYLIIIFKI